VREYTMESLASHVIRIYRVNKWKGIKRKWRIFDEWLYR
jgi:hypothetical protein